MLFHRVHVEVTNVCGLACSFCPPKRLPSKKMDLLLFEHVLIELEGKTRELAFHVMGDPLTLSNLSDYLDAAVRHGFAVALTTSGYYLSRTPVETLFHPAVKQLNVSLNSYNKNSLDLTFDAYMDAVLAVCDEKLARYPKPFVNLRLWNLDEACSEAAFNTELFTRLSRHFGVPPDAAIAAEGAQTFRLAPKVRLAFDRYFEWPSLQSAEENDGSCYGLRSHIGILADGTVVPCCLDGDGIINLGNLNETSLNAILASERATTIKTGFLKGKAVEALCRKCRYKERFNQE